MIKNFKIEVLILALLFFSIYFSYNFDSSLYFFFKDLNNEKHYSYLVDFFKQITVLGDSKWYFVFLVVAFFFLKLMKKSTHFNDHKINIKKIISLVVFLFASLLLSGAITQTLKHIFGRPRPNYAFDGVAEFSFFNLSSNFHSFPSGHASTIFTISIFLSILLPRIKYLFIFLACLVALSRIVVGAHFFSDIVAGLCVAFIGIKLARLIQKKYFSLDPLSYTFSLLNKNSFLLIIFWIMLVLLFTIGSSIDLFITSLFYLGGQEFVLQSFYKITIFFRKFLLPAIIIYILFLPILSFLLPIKKIYFNYKFVVKDLLFLWTISFFNLLLIVNLALKNFWGRGRPGDVFEFGGSNDFSPWYEFSNTCLSNCSFVSGDSAVGFSLAALFVLTKKYEYLWASVVLGFSIGLIRIMEGGHFFSDVVMSSVVIYLLVFLEGKFFYKK